MKVKEFVALCNAKYLLVERSQNWKFTSNPSKLHIAAA